MTRAKVIPIASARENPAVLEEAYRSIAAELRAGELVCIFPEGQITHDGDLSVFKPGVLKIIGDTPVPVVPMALHGLWGSLFSRKGGPAMLKLPRRFWARIELRVGVPEDASEVRMEGLSAAVAGLLGAGGSRD